MYNPRRADFIATVFNYRSLMAKRNLAGDGGGDWRERAHTRMRLGWTDPVVRGTGGGG